MRWIRACLSASRWARYSHIYASAGWNAEGAGGAITWDRLSASALFYGFLFIGILFFWDLGAQFNWDTFAPGSEGIYGAAWIVIYALFAPLAITLGLRMQRAARGGQ